MAPTPLIKKLRIQPGQRILILNAPTGYVEALGPLPEDVEWSDEPQGEYDCVHLFVPNVAELERLGPAAIAAVRYDGLLWISYPKRSAKVKTDISRDVGWDLLAQAGLRPVTQVSIDSTWSALRWRPTNRVGSR